ncbi:MAG: hypothetical protein JXQ75_06855 [Phycisphaerae bacterium]|nr:hypothetical protein [Phycisphaerae bacterium]
MTKHKNFAGKTTPAVIDVEYRDCNFSQRRPEERDGKKVGVRLFPGDDTPRTFIRCNLVNCEPPPGSTLVTCNTAIVEPVTDIGGGKQGLQVHGRYDAKVGDYVYLKQPRSMEWPDEFSLLRSEH